MSKWIPVTERMPEEHDEGISTVKWNDDVSDDVLITLDFGDGERWVTKSKTRNGKWEVEFITGWKVLAWMPLPKPYMEDANDNV